MANMAIRIKFRGTLPDRIALNSAVYRVRPHTLPVLRCTCCLLFGHGNAFCNGKIRCGRCSGYHDAEACARPETYFFCDGNHCLTYRQCLAYLQALQLQQLLHEPDHTITEVKCKLRGIHPGSFRPTSSPEENTAPPQAPPPASAPQPAPSQAT